MKHWKDIAFGLFVSLTLAACYGEEDSVSETNNPKAISFQCFIIFLFKRYCSNIVLPS